MKLFRKKKDHHEDNARRAGILTVLWRNNYTRIIIFTILPIIIAAGLFAYINPQQQADAAWYGTSGWSFRKKLVIDAAKVSGSSNHSNFPILLSRIDTDLKDNAQSDGDDILFTSADGTTKLDHEIESYTSATGELIAWVEISTLDNDDDTTIYMYYGNSAASSQQNPTGIWSNYATVLHLKEDASVGAATCSGGAAGEVLCDSTGNTNHGDGLGGWSGDLPSSSRISGKIGYALKTNADDEYVSLGDIASTRNISQLTISYWHRRPSSNNIGIFGKQTSDETHGSVLKPWDDGNIYFDISDGSNANGSVVNNTTTWQYLTLVFDGSLSGNSNRLKGFIDDTQQSLSFSGTVGSTTTNNTQPWRIGRDGSGGGSSYRGEYDESRIYLGIRSTDWIATEYSNQNDPTGFFKQVSTAQAESQSNSTSDLAYTMDEGYGTTLSSTGSNNHNGTISGALWRTEDLCVSGKCLYFDGSNDVVTTTGTTNDVKTVAFWVRPMTTTEQLVDLNGTASISVSSGTISATSFTSPTIYVDGKPASTLVANRWQHVTVTTGTGLSASALKLGQISTNYGQLFMDEFQIYSSELSANQVKSLYNSRGGNLTGVQFGAYDQKSLSDGLVGYWRFDETTGNATDSSGNATTLTNNSTTPYTGSKFGNSGEMDGSTDYFEAADNSPLSVTGSVTLTSWINNDDTTGSQNIIGKWDGTNNSYLLALEGDELRMYIDSSSDYQTTSAANISSNTFTHVAGIYDSSSRTVRLYVNGVEQPSSTTGTIPASIGDDAGEVIIGADDSPANYFDGHIDESRIYNRALSSSEIQQLYTWAPGPVGHWKLDENTGITANDVSTNDNTGTITGATWKPGQYGGSLQFDGTDDLINAGSNTILDDIAAKTISMWVNLRSTDSTSNRLFEKTFSGWTYAAVPVGSRAVHYEQQYSTTNGQWLTSSDVLPLNTWTHVAISHDRTTTAAPVIYINGIAQALTTGSTPSGTPGSEASGDLYIGNNSDGNRSFEGTIDDIKLYNYLRTPSQVIQDMNAGHPIVGTPIAGPVGHWKFDEGYGTTANNAGLAGSTINATLTNMAIPATSTSGWTAGGKFDKALNFDGTNDYVVITDNENVEGANLTTVSLWLKAPTASSYRKIFYKNSVIDIGLDNNGEPFAEIAGVGNFSGIGSGNDIDDNAWHHLLITHDSSTNQAYAYIDGKLKETITTTGSIASSANNLFIGHDGSTEYFQGTIDEVRIFNTFLTVDNVLQEYNTGKSLILGSTGTESDGVTPSNSASREYCVPGDTDTCNPPIAEWSFDEGNGTTVNDISGGGSSGNWAGSGTPRFTVGKLGKAGNFTGEPNDDHIDITSMTSTLRNIGSGSNQITISGWIYPRTFGGGGLGFIISPGWGVGPSLILDDGTFTNNSLRFIAGSTASNSSADVINTNQWQHIAVAYNGGTTSGTFYVNGRSTGTTGNLGNLTNSTDTWDIGNSPNESDRHFDGRIDSLKIYDYIRTPAQIAWDYNRGEPIALWRFDEESGTTAYDASGNGINGTLTNTPSRTTSGKYGSAISFDGTDDYITVGSPATLDNLPTYDFSVTGWINATTFGENNAGRIVDKGTAGNGWGFFICGTGQTCNQNSLSFYQQGNTQDGWWSSAINSISTGSWIHTAVVYADATGSIDPLLYINGELQTITEHTTHTGGISDDNAETLHIGNRAATDRTFDGILDDIRIYNYPLTAQQIKLIINDNTAIRFAPSAGSP